MGFEGVKLVTITDEGTVVDDSVDCIFDFSEALRFNSFKIASAALTFLVELPSKQ